MEDLKIIPYRKKNKWGFCNSKKQILIECVFDKIEVIHEIEIFYKIKKNEKYGIIDQKGKWVHLIEFDEIVIDTYVGWKVFLLNTGHWMLFDIYGKRLGSGQYSIIEKFVDNYAKVCLNGKWGYINQYGEEIVECKYDYIDDMNYGYAPVMNKDFLSQNWGAVDNHGNEIIKPAYKVYNEVRCFTESLIKVSKDYKWGLTYRNGEQIVPCKYSWIKDFKEGRAAVELFGQQGFIDQFGNEIIPCKYSYVSDFNDGISIVKFFKKGEFSEESWSFINVLGQEISIAGSFDAIEYFKDDIFKVSFNKKFAFLRITRHKELKLGLWGSCQIITVWFDSINDFREGFCAVQIYDKCGFINESFEIFIPVIYDFVSNFNDGFAALKLKNKWAIINREGKILCPFKYSNIEHYGGNMFVGGLAIVELDGGWEVYDKETNKIFYINDLDELQNIYHDSSVEDVHDTSEFSFSYMIFGENGDWGYYTKNGVKIYGYSEEPGDEFLTLKKMNPLYGLIDMHGKEVIPCKYSGLGFFKDGLAKINVNEKWGFIDLTQEIVIECKYDDVSDFDFGYSIVKLDGAMGIIDKWGNQICRPQYHDIYLDSSISEQTIIVQVKKGGGYYDDGIRYGLLDKFGKIIVPFIYTYFFIHNDLIEVSLNSHSWDFIDFKGTQFWED